MAKKAKTEALEVDVWGEVYKMVRSYDFTKYNLYVVDLFCGFGGVTEGIEKAKVLGKKVAKVIACINHDPGAILSHYKNHPGAIHLTEDITKANLAPLKYLIDHIRKVNPLAKILLWASPDCTNHSKAKGGKSRKADSRTLATALFRYVRWIKPDMLWMENVVEFKIWGRLMAKVNKAKGNMGENCPLEYDKATKQLSATWIPHPEYLSEYYDRFVMLMKRLGNYEYAYREINTADLGGHTSRNRLFIQFNKKDVPIVWPTSTHAKNPKKKGLPSGLKKWKAVKEVLDLDEKGESIFERKKPLSPKTHERLFWGLVKFIAGGKKNYAQYMVKWLGTSSTGHMKNCSQSLETTAPTITTQNRYGMASVEFITKYYSGDPYSKNVGLDQPCPTIKTVDNNFVVSAKFIDNYNGRGTPSSVSKPSPTLRTKDSKSLVSPKFIYRDFSNGGSHQPINGPAGSLTTNPKISLVTTSWIQNKTFDAYGHNHTIDAPSPTLLAKKEKELVSVEPWLMNNQFNNIGSEIGSSSPALTTGKNYYLINPQWGVNGNKSVNEPCFTLIARMDKTPPHLVTVEDGGMAIVINEEDDYWMRMIKEFMAAFGISDIRMRMLFIKEKLRIQGMPENYKMVGTQTDQNKWIGNLVTPKIPKSMVETTYNEIFPLHQPLLKAA